MADQNSDPTNGLQNHEAVATPEHQLLMDRFKALWQGAWDYTVNHLPEHPNLKGDVLNHIKAAWDNTAAVIKGDAETAFQKLKEEGQQAEQTALAAGEQIATDAASGVEQAAGSVVESNAGKAPAGTTADSGASSSAGVETTPSAPASTDTPTK